MPNYIDNKKFEHLIKCYTLSGARGEVESDLMDMFDILIDNIITGFNFKSLEHEDGKQECFLLILKTLKNFDPSNGAAFNYFTTIIVNNLRLLYTKHKKYNQKIANYKEFKYGIPGIQPSSNSL